MYETILLKYLLLNDLFLYLGVLFRQFQQILPAVLNFHIQQTLLQILNHLGIPHHHMDHGFYNLPKLQNQV